MKPTDAARNDVVNAEDPEWEALVLDDAAAHHVQTGAWLRVRTEIGARFDRVCVREAGRLVAGVQLQLLDLPVVGPVGVGIAGPVFADASPSTRRELVEALITWMEEGRRGGVLIHPQVEDEALTGAFERMGFHRSPIAPRLEATAVLDLDRDPDSILAGMHSKTRYNIRVGRRRGVTIREAGEEGPAAFASLLEATAERQGFDHPMGERELRLITTYMDDRPVARIFLAEVEGDIVSGALVIGHGRTAVYKRGAWNGRRGDAHPNEVMHAEMIEWARRTGFALYDFDGMDAHAARRILAGETPEVSGVTRFKLKFGSRPVLLPPPTLRFRNPALHTAGRLVERLPQRVRHALEAWSRQRW